MKTIIKTNYFSRVFLYGLIFSLCIFPLSAKARQTSSKKDLCIVIDPGHGGIQSGTQRGTVEEKTLNLKIAQYLKEALEKYKGVTVSLTRDGDYDVSLTDRTQYSVDKNADLMVSIHNNATGDCAAYDSGCTVLAAKDGYKQELADEEQKLACNILNELSALGIENQGILLRDSEANEKYENGELADYYAIIRGGAKGSIKIVFYTEKKGVCEYKFDYHIDPETISFEYEISDKFMYIDGPLPIHGNWIQQKYNGNSLEIADSKAAFTNSRMIKLTRVN